MEGQATLPCDCGEMLGIGHCRRYCASRALKGTGQAPSSRKTHLLMPDAPVMVSVIDSEDKIQRLLPFLDEVVAEGLIATSEVEVIKYVHQDGMRSE